MTDTPLRRLSPTGLLYALLAYASWGLFPLYWKFFTGVSPLEVVSHRVIWSLVLLIILMTVLRRWEELKELMQNPGRLAVLFLTAILLSCNWGIFIYGVASSQVVQTSLGYFINPLVSILLAFIFLKERLNRAQTAAVILAACGVIHFGWHLGKPPLIALGLAFTFGLYGLLRKVVHVTPLAGLTVETALMCPLALIIIGTLSKHGAAHFNSSATLTLLFVGAGVVTTVPLLWFNSATKLLPLSTMGFLQYVAPTLQLLTGVVVFREPFEMRQAISFILIWLAIGIYLVSILHARGKPPLNAGCEPEGCSE